MKIKMVLMLLLVMLCYTYGYYVQECINKYDENEKRRLCVSKEYYKIMFEKMQDKLNQAYQDC